MSSASKVVRYILRTPLTHWKKGAMLINVVRHRKPPVRRGEILYPAKYQAPHSPWTYQSENWARVVDRHRHRKLLLEGKSLTLVDDPEVPGETIRLRPDSSVCAKTRADGSDRWVYLYLPPSEYLWRNFDWTFRVRRGTDFRELQFGFRYRDFYNRYRFRHESDYVYFDKVLNGRFFNSLAKKPFRMELGREYTFSIRCYGYYFSLDIDGSTIIEAYDGDQTFAEGSIAIILWEDNGRTPIDLEIADQSVYELIAD